MAFYLQFSNVIFSKNTYDVHPIYKKAIIVGCKSQNVDSNRLLKILLGMECKNYCFNNIHFYEPVKGVFGYTYVQEKQIKQYHEHTDTLITQLIQDFENLKQHATNDIGLQEDMNSYLYLPRLLDSLIKNEHQYLRFYRNINQKIHD